MSYSNQIKLSPFSEKYINYYKRCFSHSINCLEGAYRAGKLNYTPNLITKIVFSNLLLFLNFSKGISPIVAITILSVE